MKKLLMRLIVTSGFLIGGSSIMSAASCVTDTLANYVSSFGGGTGCTLTNGSVTLTFSNFSGQQLAASGPVVGGTTSLINLVPIIDGNGIGFNIVPIGAWSAGATGVNDLEVIFRASVLGGAASIDGVYLAMTGSAGASNVGGGQAGRDFLDEYICRGGNIPPTSPNSCPAPDNPIEKQLTITGAASNQTVSTQVALALTSSVSISKDIKIDGLNGGASLTSVVNQVHVTPEPSTISLLVGCGLVGLLGARRRKMNV